jgi:hypothetical protein
MALHRKDRDQEEAAAVMAAVREELANRPNKTVNRWLT